jgi:hypothetical protein
MRSIIQRAAAATGVAVVASTLPLVMAAPASATPAQCADFLKREGHVVGSGVKHACKRGADFGGWAFCYNELLALRVKSDDADRAATSHSPTVPIS